MSIRVAIVEDDTSVRNNLAKFIDDTPGFAGVAACASAEEGWGRIPTSGADVALVDINLPGKSGVEFVREFTARTPAPRSSCSRSRRITSACSSLLGFRFVCFHSLIPHAREASLK